MGESTASRSTGRRRPEAGRSERAWIELDLDGVLRAALRQLARISGCESAVVWRRGVGGEAVAVDAAAPDASAARAVPRSREAYTELACLSHATDLGADGLPADLESVAREHGFSAAAPVARRDGEALAVLLLAGRRDAPGRVRPRTLRALDAAARRLETPLAATASFARLGRLDAEVVKLDRSAALGELLAEVVHEIRNPLVSVKTFLQLLPDRANDPEFQTGFATVVEEELRRIERLLDAVLDHARPPASSPAGARVGVAPALESVALLLEHRAADRSVRIEVEAAPNLPGVAISGDGLRQVILNLALNAIDATEPGGAVRLRAHRVRDGVEVVVEDQGRGIPEPLRDRVFEPFFSTKPDQRGGLGLAISRRIVEQAGGRIALSDRAGGGSAFRVQLPARQVRTTAS